MFDPANVAPVVTYLASPRCRLTGRVVNAVGGNVVLYGGWHPEVELDRPQRVTIDELVEAFGAVPATPPPFDVPGPLRPPASGA